MRTSFLIIVLLFYSLCSFGQRTEVSVSYGTPSIYGAVESIVDDIANTLNKSEASTSSNGILSIGIQRYSASQKWRYGGIVDFEFFSTEGLIKRKAYYSISPAIDYFWNSAEHKFRVYTGFSAGVLFKSEKYLNDQQEEQTDSAVFLAVNLTPVGISYGQKFRVFLETNIGNRGILQLGLAYTF